MKGAIFISDERLKYANDYLREKGINADCYDSTESVQWLSLEKAADYDFVLLPIRGTEDGTIFLNNEKVDIDVYLRALRPDTLLMAGITYDYEKALPCQFFNFQDDDAFALKNAQLTAEGILYMILQNTSKSIYDLTYDMIGCGKVGTATQHILCRLGLQVRMISHSNRKDCISIEGWKDTIPSDIVINTSPVLSITKEILDSWQKEVTIIDISSKKAGTDKSVTGRKNIAYFPAPPLPGVITPETSGRMLAELMFRMLMKK